MQHVNAPLPAGSGSANLMDLRFLVHLARTGATGIHPMGRAATDALISRLDLRPGQHVLEVGCGTGGTMARLCRYALARLDGVDVLPDMLQAAGHRLRVSQRRGQTGLYQVAACGTLPFSDDAYDRVYTESVLGMQDGVGATVLLAEVFRVLKPGGLYIANEAIWKAGVSEERIHTINDACLADFGARQASAAPWRLDDWLRIMDNAGFRVITANLLEQELPTSTASPLDKLRALLSEAVTRFSRLAGYLTPSRYRTRQRYRRLLEQHRTDGQFIEARLFVLQKPLQPAS